MQRVPTLALTMSSRGRACTAVLDTNVVLDWLVFRDARVAPLVSAVEAGDLQLIATPAMRSELSQMLASRRLARWSPDAAAVLAAYDLQVPVLPDADPRLARKKRMLRLASAASRASLIFPSFRSISYRQSVVKDEGILTDTPLLSNH